MTLLIRLLAVFALVLPAMAQQEPQQTSQLAAQSHPSSQLGVRYSAATDVSHISFNSPLVTYGSSLNEIQLPAAPIQPANLKQAPQDSSSSENASQEDQRQTLVRSYGNQQQAVQAEHQIQAAQHQSNLNQQQFISVQQYPARQQVQAIPQGFSLRQDLPGPQPQAVNRYAQQFPTVQSQPPVLQQQQYVQPQVQYATAQPQIQYASAQPQIQYASAPPQVQYTSASPQAQYPTAQPQQYVLPQNQQQVQYQNPVSYSSPTSNAYFATGPFAAQYPTSNLVAGQYTAQLSAQAVAPQYAQSVSQPQYAAQQSTVPVGYSSAPAQLVSRVSFSGPTAGFSYGF